MNTTRLLRVIAATLSGLMIGAAAWASSERGPVWTSLTPAQQQALAPLQSDWAGIDVNRKQKWLAVAARFPSLPPDERLRVQQRMTEWTRLTPAERNNARLQFKEARQVSPEERQAKWQAYQALPEAERQSLANRAQPAIKPTPTSATIAGAAANDSTRPRASSADGATKQNLVQAPGVNQVKPVAPVVVQAKPGATTSNITTRPPKPSHSQPGLPKIAATPGYVDAATLLPKRGAQGAAAASSADDIHPN